MEKDKSRSIWELLSDAFREMGILLWVFGAILEHNHADIEHGGFMAGWGVVSFAIGLFFEKCRDKKSRGG